MNINTLINRKKTYSNIFIDTDINYDSNMFIDTDINYDYNILKYLEDKLNNIIKYNKNINKLNTDTLYLLYIAIGYKTKNKEIYNEIISSYKLHKFYIIELNNYIDMVNNINCRKYVYNILSSFNTDIDIDKFNNNSIVHNINIDDNLLNNICISKHYNLEQILEYNLSVNNFKTNTIDSIEKIKLISNDIEKNILTELINKLNNNYKIVQKFTNPEIDIFNKLIDIKDNRILYVFNHFTLPIFRVKNHPLYADFLLLLNINNKLNFAIIEYDGPTHDNIYDFRFKKETILCDIIKNNFCLYNNISMLRIKYNQNNINYHIDHFINNILNDKYIFIIPSYEYYMDILNKYN